MRNNCNVGGEGMGIAWLPLPAAQAEALGKQSLWAQGPRRSRTAASSSVGIVHRTMI